MATALRTLMSLPIVRLAAQASPVHPLDRLAAALGPDSPRLLIKRDDLLSFGWGGNKVRKLQTVLAEARAAGADTLITCGGLQSNHARVTAAAGAVLGMKVILVLNGDPPAAPTGNLKLDELFGAHVRYVASREARAPAMQAVADEIRGAGGNPFVIPLGASTATGALGFARGLAELPEAGIRPDVIVHASSSGGTQAGIIAGCALIGLTPRILGVSADESADVLGRVVRNLLVEMAVRLGSSPAGLGIDGPMEVDDRQVGEGYGVPTPAALEATSLLARHEGVVLDPVYTSKAMASLIALVRAGAVPKDRTVLFWHTGGQPF